MTVELRPAGEDDQRFFAEVYASTRTEELAVVPWSAEQKAAFLAHQFTAQTTHYAQHYADATRHVIVADGEAAGRLIVTRRDDEMSIVDISLLPRFRSLGIGTRLLRELIAEADERGAKLTIHVERMNPALTLYRRLDFQQVHDDGVYLRMQRPASESRQGAL